MATDDGSSISMLHPTDGVSDPLVCPVCLDPFTDPRFLPCHHTYCTHCIQDLADKHKGGEFPCPSCRRPATLPDGGVKDLQVNFYVNAPVSLQVSLSETDLLCETHVGETLRFYCTKCRLAICRDCKLTQHDGHSIENIRPAQQRIQDRMKVVQTFFRDRFGQLNRQVDSVEKRKEDAMSKKESVVKSIQDRHATLVAAADKARDEALQSLNTVMRELEEDYDAQMDTITASDTFRVTKFKVQELEQFEAKNIVQTLALAASMSVNVELDDSEIQQELEQQVHFPWDIVMDSQVQSVVHRCPLTEACSVNSLVQMSRDFVGSVVKTALTDPADEECQVKLLERFTCEQEPNTRIFSLCHCDEDDADKSSLYVSFDYRGLDTNVPVRLFSETGKLKRIEGKTGTVSHKRYSKGWVMGPPQEQGWFCTYTKSLTAGHYRLDNVSSGRATIKSIKATSTDSLRPDIKTEFQIKVGPHRAVDVDDTDKLFVVLEEPQPPQKYRQVHLYRRGTQTRTSTYTSPIQPFQPSDVCFYTLGGQRVLLIADEANDAIHVVRVEQIALKFRVEETRLRFLRYLAPGCPCLVQPTAINVDVKGRLWVACAGGRIITMEPTGEVDSAVDKALAL